MGAEVIVSHAVADAAGEGGYARELTPDEQRTANAELAATRCNDDVSARGIGYGRVDDIITTGAAAGGVRISRRGTAPSRSRPSERGLGGGERKAARSAIVPVTTADTGAVAPS